MSRSPAAAGAWPGYEAQVKWVELSPAVPPSDTDYHSSETPAERITHPYHPSEISTRLYCSSELLMLFSDIEQKSPAQP